MPSDIFGIIGFRKKKGDVFDTRETEELERPPVNEFGPDESSRPGPEWLQYDRPDIGHMARKYPPEMTEAQHVDVSGDEIEAVAERRKKSEFGAQ